MTAVRIPFMTAYHYRTPGSRPASMKQLAYLRYMNVAVPEALDETGADALARDLDQVGTYEEWRTLVDRKCSWRIDRFLLHPKLFHAEFEVYYHQELPAQLKTFLFHHAPPTLRRLSLGAVRDTMKKLSGQDPGWWHRPKFQEQFFTLYMKDEADRPAPAQTGPPEGLWHELKEALTAFAALAPDSDGGLGRASSPRMASPFTSL